MAEQLHSALAILRLNQVQRRTGLSRSTIYAKLANGTFPGSVRLSERAVGWPEHEVTAWLEERIAASRQEAAK